jgi:hypothetical protein
LAGPSRLASIVIVTVLSCVVLGAVWSLVLYTLPQSDLPPEPTPAFSPPQPATPSAPARTDIQSQPTPEPISQRRRSYKPKPGSILRLNLCARRSGEI